MFLLWFGLLRSLLLFLQLLSQFVLLPSQFIQFGGLLKFVRPIVELFLQRRQPFFGLLDGRSRRVGRLLLLFWIRRQRNHSRLLSSILHVFVGDVADLLLFRFEQTGIVVV